MREILFRGKSTDTSAWVYGYYCGPFGDFDEHEICDIADPTCSRVDVDPDTVGQYTGLIDKNGKRIFEGDILAFPDTGEDGYEYKEGYDFTNVATVCWNNGRWELEDFGDENSGVMDDMDVWHWDFVAVFNVSEIIGNIHDNPELIGGAKDEQTT